MSKSRKRRPGNPAARAKAEPIDFDAVRAKKRRTLRQISPIKIGGRDYTLSPTIPLAVTEKFAENTRPDNEGNLVSKLADMQDILRMLFGDDQWAEICKVIDSADVPPLFTTVFEAYSESVGESSASGAS